MGDCTENNHVCSFEICPECLNNESEGLWIYYYEHYRTAINALLSTGCAEQCFLPLLNLTSTYIELWIKVIGMNYGLGSDNSVEVEMITGHNLTRLMERLRDIISWDEYRLVEKDFFRVWEIIDGLIALTAEENISLSEAMRYPETKKESSTIGSCLLGHLTERCDKFIVGEIIDDVGELMRLTYKIYNKIYEFRVL